jgi:putative tricarboxylic transport membrane protein
MQSSSKVSESPTPWSPSRLIIPLGIITFCVLAFWLSTQFERVPPILKRGIQPSDFPQLVLGLMIFLSVVLIFKDDSDAPERISSRVWSTMGLLVGFVLVTEVDLFLGLGLFTLSLALLWGERRIWALALVSVIVPFAVFILFDVVFEIRFPRGLLTNIWYA